jgi:hypothetical protein
MRTRERLGSNRRQRQWPEPGAGEQCICGRRLGMGHARSQSPGAREQIRLSLVSFHRTQRMMREDNVSNAESCEESFLNRRRHLRSVFTYPVEIKFISRKLESVSFVGYLKDISLGGAGLEIEDPYGRLNINEAKSGRVILTLNIPRENKTHVLAHIRWIEKKGGTGRVEMGIAFKHLDYGDVTAIERLIGLKGKDHNMMWNLWEQYYR